MTTDIDTGQRAPDPPPIPPTTTIHVVQLTMPGIRALCILAALVAPGVLIGAAIAYRIWRRLHPQSSGRWASAIVLALIGALFVPAIVWFWPLRLLFGLLPRDGNLVVSVIGEALWGPLVLQALLHVTVYERRLQRTQSVSPGASVSQASSPPASAAPLTVSCAHPPKAIRLGVNESGVPFDLFLDELKQHVFIPGLPGTGKTTTIIRLVDGALTNNYGVVIVDFKGGALRTEAEKVARAHGCTPYIVSTSAPDSYGYNPCTGPGFSVANKIAGALSFGSDAKVYRDIALAVIPPVVDALRATGAVVTLDRMRESLTQKAVDGLVISLSKKPPSSPRILTSLKSLLEAGSEKVFANGRDGLRSRLMAFTNGTFGELLDKEPALNWNEVLAQPSVAYIELPVLGANEDTDLLARVILQDLKEVAMERIEAKQRGKKVDPILLIIDEFAALKDIGQINALLLQSREAEMKIVVATQYLPEDEAMRKVVVGADVLLVHRVQAADAEIIAKQVGTHSTMETSFTTDDNRDPQSTTPRQSTNVRATEKFNVEPQMLANLPTGWIAVRSVGRLVNRSKSGWYGLVNVYRKE